MSSGNHSFFTGQFLHLILLLILLFIAGYVAAARPSVLAGEWLGLSTAGWFWLTVAAAIIHQTWTWIMWRLELHGKRLTRIAGERSFTLFKIFFALFGLSRFLIIPLAYANRGTIAIPGWLQWPLAILFTLLGLYLFYSVIRYFGLNRALGNDHFRPEEARSWPMVDQGIFRFTSNGMYLYGFLLLWVPGLIFESSGALLAAAFQHCYIWVHYYCTEKPDMDFIYG